ncbi:MAG: anti-sigma factor domain-containing protein [Thermomicrobiales bacterium]
MTDLQHDDVADLLPAYALGALDRVEAIAVADHVSDCPICRTTLADYDAVVLDLNTAASTAPPAALRKRVLASAERAKLEPATPSAPRVAHGIGQEPAAPGSPRRLRFVAFGLAAAAVALIVAVAVLAAMLADTRQSRDEAAAAEAQLASYLSAGGDVMAMTSLAAANYGYSFGQGSLVTAPDKLPMIVVGGCPESDTDREYRVWVERDGDRTRVGVLDVGDEGSGWLTFEPPEPLANYDSIGVTMVTGEDERSDLFIGATEATTT